MLRNHAYMGDYTVLTRLNDGPKIYLDTRELSVSGHLILDGYWEKWVTDVFKASIGPGMTVCDIGTHCGYYALIAAQLVGSTGQVHCFEPNPFHHNNLLKSKMINGFYHMKIHPYAVADQEKEMTLFSPERLIGSASLSQRAIESIATVDQINTLNVRAVQLENYLGDIHVDVFKLDIEGFEPFVLPSVLNMMDRIDHPKLFLEFNRNSWENEGFDCVQILKGITDRGYRIDLIQHNSTLVSVQPEEIVQRHSTHSHFDLLITKNHKKGE